MSTAYLPISQTRLFSPLIQELVDSPQNLDAFIKSVPSLDAFSEAMSNKNFDQKKREILYERLKAQNEGLNLSKASQRNLESLKEENSFTVCTGHQLNLFTGPLYYIYKILHVISLAEELSSKLGKRVVPLFWMATEDHDFDEIKFCHLFGKKLTWDSDQSGAVGRFNLEGIDEVLEELASVLGEDIRAKQLYELIEEAYSQPNLAAACRFIVNALFSPYGILILDGDDKELKGSFSPILEKELFAPELKSKVAEQNELLKSKAFKVQAHARDINLFYLSENHRKRIVQEEDVFTLVDGQKTWTKEELKKELKQNPENFSPNALLRPMYQEFILPNLAYVGGGGELAYWLQLKKAFEAYSVEFPLLILRQSFLLMDSTTRKKMDKFSLRPQNLFDDLELWKKKLLNSDVELDFSREEADVLSALERVEDRLLAIDSSLKGYYSAEEKKVMKVLQAMEKKGLQALKKKNESQIQQLEGLRRRVYPEGKLQERYSNYFEFYLKREEGSLDYLLDQIDPLKQEFICLDW